MKKLLILCLLFLMVSGCKSSKQPTLTCTLEIGEGYLFTYVYTGEKPVTHVDMDLAFPAEAYGLDASTFELYKEELLADMVEAYPGFDIEVTYKDDKIHYIISGEIADIDVEEIGGTFDFDTISYQEITEFMQQQGGSCK